jgi:hypothetical protein
MQANDDQIYNDGLFCILMRCQQRWQILQRSQRVWREQELDLLIEQKSDRQPERVK